MTNHPALLKRLAAFFVLAAFATVLDANPAEGFTPDSPALEKVTPPVTEISGSAVAGPNAPMAPGDCPAELEPNESAGAAIDFPMGIGALNLALCPDSDVDWFRVPMTAGVGFRMETYDIQKADVKVDTILTLFDAGLSSVAANDDRSTNPEPLASMLVYTPAVTGDYFLRAKGFSTTGSVNHQYTLRVTNLCNEAYEPDNTAGQATPFPLGHVTHRALCAFADQDWVSVDLAANIGYRFETVVNGATDTKLTVYATDGATPLLTDDDAGIGFGSLLVYTPTASGTYFVKAFASTASGSGSGRTYEWLIAPLTSTTLTVDSPCVMDQLWAAVNLARDGDTIAFNCGSGPGVSPFIFPFDLQQIGALKTLTYDGGGLVAFSGLRWNRHLYNHSGKTLTVRNLSLLRGGGRDTVGAGAVYNAGGSILSLGPVVIENSEVSRNSTLSTTYGGGALYTNQPLTITGSRFHENLSNSGGAFYLDATARADIRDSEFVSNTARGAYGGAISNLGVLNLTHVLMSRNTLRPASFPFGNESGGALTNFTGARATLISSQLISNTSTEYGGAIGNFSFLTITGSTISENRSKNGGGIYAYGTSQLAIVDSAIISNSAIGGSHGGGILNYGSLTLTSSTIARNRSDYGGGASVWSANIDDPASISISNSLFADNAATGGDGGGLHLFGRSADIVLTRFVSNSATARGGGLIRDSGSARLLDVTFAGNRSGINGGGVSIRGTNPRMSIDRSLFVNNHADQSGGGVSNSAPGVWLTNTTFSENTAGANGGGFADLSTGSPEPIRLVHVSFVGNSANSGGALHRLNAVNTLYMTSTLISRTVDNTGGNCAGLAPTGIANSISSDLTCDVFGPANGGNNLENIDPLVGPLAWNGGATRTHLPLPGSPAIDMAPSGPSRDQRGASRPYGAGYDVGAVEAGPVVPNIFPYSTFVPAALR